MYLMLFICIFFSTIALSEESAIDERMQEEAHTEQSKFSIIPHKPNYILPVTYNSNMNNYDEYQKQAGKSTSVPIEVKFQISLKMPVFHHINHLPISGYFAYTQTSFWQAYNLDGSSPFRETNYEPEAFLLWDADQTIGLGWKFKLSTFGFTHQSNGQSEPISRSWNRLNANFAFEYNTLVINLNPWYRIEDTDDNNPDLLEYYGNGKITFIYKDDENTYSLMSRNNLQSGFSKGAIQASWSFPLYGKVNGYIQAFSGYGDSLTEYNVYSNTLGIGISISDFL